jgi:hypothetical protein
MEGICLFGFDDVQRGLFALQPSPLYAQETQLPASCLLGLRHNDSCSGLAFPPSRQAKTLLCSVWQYSIPGVCQTVTAGPDILALPL